MLGFDDFIWKNHLLKNIEGNPVDEIYCIIENKDSGSYIKYGIKMQYEMDSEYMPVDTDNAKYFIVFIYRSSCIYDMFIIFI